MELRNGKRARSTKRATSFGGGNKRIEGRVDYAPVGFEKMYTKHAELPAGRTTYDNSRFPQPMKINTGLDIEGWKKNVIPMIGLDGERGIQAKYAK